MNIALAIAQLHQIIPPAVLLIILLVALVLFALISWVFVYHWNKYGNNDVLTLKLIALYFFGSAIIISLALIALIFY